MVQVLALVTDAITTKVPEVDTIIQKPSASKKDGHILSVPAECFRVLVKNALDVKGVLVL
jgi:hypothetical protein